MKKVLIVNCINSDNFGDQEIGNQLKKFLFAIGASFDVADIALRKREYDFKNLPKSPGDLSLKKRSSFFAAFDAYFSFLKWVAKHRDAIRSIVDRGYDCLIFGGGELIQSNYTFPRMIKFWTKLFLKKNKHSRICFFSVGVTSAFTKGDRSCFNYVFNRTELFYVRDKASVLNLKNAFGIKPCLVPDVVYSLEEERVNEDEGFAIYGITSINRILKYSFKGIKTIEEYFEYSYEDLLAKYLKQKKRVVLFYEDISDKRFCLLFANYVKNKKNVELEVADYETAEGFKSFILSSRFVSSPRMHACILALLYKKEVDVIKISPKLQSFENDYLRNRSQDKKVLKEELNNLIGTDS